MRLARQVTGGLGALLVALGSLGCSGNNPVYPVQGMITFEGKPMKGGGSISLIPIKNQAGKAAGGEIMEDGTYKLTTYRPGDGSMVGEFRVVINQVVEKEPEATPDGEKAAKTTMSVPPAERIPMIYSDPSNSPLTIKVDAKSLNELNLDLKRSAQLDGRPPGGA